MLSRRSVRIKIMQLLYGANLNETAFTTDAMEQRYRRAVHETYRLYLYSLLQMQRIVEYTQRDASFRENKLVITPEDRAFDSRFLQNAVSQALVNNEVVTHAINKEKLRSLGDADLIRSHYYEFLKTDTFQAYNALLPEALTEEVHRQLLLDLYKHLLNQELFTDSLEDAFVNWEDDKSLVIGAVKRSIRAVVEDAVFSQKFLPEEETVGEFGSELLFKIVHFYADMNTRINAKFENWDPDRITAIDRILILMSLAEILYCPTIPPKVTMDEYIEIAKLYSTDKSKEFVNGVVDQLLRDVTTEGLLNKIGRGTVTETPN